MPEQNVTDYVCEFRKRVELEMLKLDWKHKDLTEAIGIEPDVIINDFK